MSEPDERGRGQSAAPPPGFSTPARLVAPLEWAALGASAVAFLCLVLPWFARSCPPGSESAGCAELPGGASTLSVSGLDLALAVTGCTLLLIAGVLPVLRYAERALAGPNAAAGTRTVLAPLFAAVGMLLVFLQLVHGYAGPALGAAGDVQRKYGLIIAFVAALIAGASGVLGHIQAHGHRLLPATDDGAPAR